MEGNDYFICVSCGKVEVSENTEMQVIINYNCQNGSLLSRHYFTKLVSTVFIVRNFTPLHI